MTKQSSRCFLLFVMVAIAACADRTPSEQLMTMAAELDTRGLGDPDVDAVEDACTTEPAACAGENEVAIRAECSCDSNGNYCVCCYEDTCCFAGCCNADCQ